MQQLSLAYKSSLINYYVFGNGSETLLCLHGYGEDGTSFHFLEKHLGKNYTLYAIDFPFHGATLWNEKEPFALNDLLTIFYSIEPQQKKFSVLAYSMGGRAAFNMLQSAPGKINTVALVAPDGLHLNFWHWITTQTALGNKAFAYTMKNPGWFFFFLNFVGKLKLFNKSVIKFVHYYLDDAEERSQLYKRWTCMRKINPDLNAIKKICAEKNIHLNLLFGKYDRIILSKRAAIFYNAKNISIEVIEAGHQLLKEKYTKQLMALLNR
ncbi:MAG: alpha/beta hydrolase [Parafilimonas sp.]|nr:alpha/beta hydrolase [Parafilimonas sp.]